MDKTVGTRVTYTARNGHTYPGVITKECTMYACLVQLDNGSLVSASYARLTVAEG